MTRPAAALRPCEAMTFDGNQQEPLPCGDPAHWCSASNGKSYLLCEAHAQLFASTLIVGDEA